MIEKPSYPLYDEDFYGWAMANAQLLRERKMNDIDFDNLIEEIESMVGNQYNEFVNRLRLLLAHLLKWQYQPVLQSRSWTLTLKEQRKQLQRLIKHNPSLKSKTQQAFLEAYEEALILAERETGLEEQTFPKNCPYTLEQCLDEEFYPE